MQVFVSRKVNKKLKKYPEFVKIRVKEAIELLRDFPTVRMDIIKIGGEKNTYRARIGEFRIIFVFEADALFVIDAEIRSKAYK